MQTALQWHSDKNHDQPEKYKAQYLAAQDAFECLYDHKRKKAYGLAYNIAKSHSTPRKRPAAQRKPAAQQKPSTTKRSTGRSSIPEAPPTRTYSQPDHEPQSKSTSKRPTPPEGRKMVYCTSDGMNLASLLHKEGPRPSHTEFRPSNTFECRMDGNFVTFTMYCQCSGRSEGSECICRLSINGHGVSLTAEYTKPRDETKAGAASAKRPRTTSSSMTGPWPNRDLNRMYGRITQLTVKKSTRENRRR